MPPGDRDCDPATERDAGGGGGGASGTPGGGGEGLLGGGASSGLGLASGSGGGGQPISRSKASLQRERAAMMVGRKRFPHLVLWTLTVVVVSSFCACSPCNICTAS